jgi:hypothetical protein
MRNNRENPDNSVSGSKHRLTRKTELYRWEE